jgi:hypothetical protein
MLRKQRCGSGMFIPDPGSRFFFPSQIPDLTTTKKGGEKLVLPAFFVALNFAHPKLLSFERSYREMYEPFDKEFKYRYFNQKYCY